MQQRKIDDNLLLELSKQGLNQKQIAEHLGVSNVAVHKRLKKLTPTPLSESLEALTESQRRFAIEIANGATATNAALKSYEVTSRESAKSIGSQLMKHPQVKEAIHVLLHEEGLTQRYRIRRLKHHVDSTDSFISLKALDMSFKLDKSYSESLTAENKVNYPQLVKEIEELEQRLKEIEEEERNDQIIPCNQINV